MARIRVFRKLHVYRALDRVIGPIVTQCSQMLLLAATTPNHSDPILPKDPKDPCSRSRAGYTAGTCGLLSTHVPVDEVAFQGLRSKVCSFGIGFRVIRD